jgi:hypothetical protein
VTRDESVAQELRRIAMHDASVATARMESAFREVAWIESSRDPGSTQPSRAADIIYAGPQRGEGHSPLTEIARRSPDGRSRRFTETAFSSDGRDSRTASAADDSHDCEYPEAGQ